MSLFTSKMSLLTAVVSEEKSEKVTAQLLKLGVIDFIKVSSVPEIAEIELKNTGVSSERLKISDLRKKIESIYSQTKLPSLYDIELSVEQIEPLDLESCVQSIDLINNEINKRREELKALNQELMKIEEVSEYFNSNDNDSKSTGGKFLAVLRGRPSKTSLEIFEAGFESYPHMLYRIPESDDCVLLVLKRDIKPVNGLLEKYGWIESETQPVGRKENDAVSEKISNQELDIKEKMESVKKSITTFISDKSPELTSQWTNLRLHELYGIIRENYSHTKKTSLFSGWLPADKADDIETVIRKTSDDQCYIEWSETSDFDKSRIPVEINHSKVLQPFRMLVTNYATPEYGAVDPTIFVAVAYTIMFGLMFGDAGQGLVIMLIGLLGKRLFKNVTEGIKNLMQLFIYCGSASIVTGILFGSYFGNALFPPLWFDYHGIVSGHHAEAGSSIQNVYDILKITIYFGISVIFLGLILNWINLIKKKYFFTLLLDKSGILGGWFYGFGVYTSFYFVGTGYKSLPEGNFIPLVFGIPVLLLFIKAPLNFYLYEKGHKQFTPFTIIDFVMEWIVELLEIFSGYLANTLSFMRVAGLGIAHVSLMTAFSAIAAMTGGGLGAIIILILGNILVIALEGLSAGIQALRLNYYEFFSRYFTGKGVAYNPVSLKNRNSGGSK